VDKEIRLRVLKPRHWITVGGHLHDPDALLCEKHPRVNGTGGGCTPESETKRKIQFLQLNGVRPVSTVDVNTGNTGTLLHIATVASHFPSVFRRYAYLPAERKHFQHLR